MGHPAVLKMTACLTPEGPFIMPDMETELYLRKGVAFRCPDPENEGREGYIRLKVGDVDKIDANGDILRAGSVGRQKVLISPYQHGVWRGAIPIGRGVIYEKDKEILFDGNLNMELGERPGNLVGDEIRARTSRS